MKTVKAMNTETEDTQEAEDQFTDTLQMNDVQNEVDQKENGKMTTEQSTIEEVKTGAPQAESVIEVKTQQHESEQKTSPPGEKLMAPKDPNTFNGMELLVEVKSAVAERGYEIPSPIQAEMIPHLLEGRDVIGQAKTGTGKTAAFALPILSRIDLNRNYPQVLVLAPTRELANQVADSFEQYAKNLKGFRVAAIYGGQSYDIQLRQLRRGVQVVVGTPGRTIDHIKRGTLDIRRVDCLVLDEADEMLNMGFLEDVQFVLSKTREDRQIALFSATMPDPIREIARQYLNDPVEIKIKSETSTVTSVRQRCLMTNGREKIESLVRILQSEETDGVIVFAKTRSGTVTIAERLMQQGFSVTALNGDMPQNQRERTVEQLRAGHLDVLVATDVAARGLDIERISHVINFDPPHDSEAYVHRIGRTGRAGRSGEAILFLTRNERGKLRMIERATGQQIGMMSLPSVDSVNKQRIAAFKQQISDTIAAQEDAVYRSIVDEYLQETNQSPELVAAALIEMARKRDPLILKEPPRRNRNDSYESRGSSRRSDDRGRPSNGRNGRPERSTRPDRGPEQGMVRYRVAVGAKHGVRPGNIVGALANEGRIDSSSIGRIIINENHSTVDLPQGVPQSSITKLRGAWVSGTQLDISVDDGSGGRSSGNGSGYRGAHRTERKSNHSKPSYGKAESYQGDKKRPKPTSENDSKPAARTKKPYSKKKTEQKSTDHSFTGTKPKPIQKPKTHSKPQHAGSEHDQQFKSKAKKKKKSSTAAQPVAAKSVAAKSVAAKSVAGKKLIRIKPTRITKDGQPKRRYKKLKKLK